MRRTSQILRTSPGMCLPAASGAWRIVSSVSVWTKRSLSVSDALRKLFKGMNVSKISPIYLNGFCCNKASFLESFCWFAPVLSTQGLQVKTWEHWRYVFHGALWHF